MNNNGFIPKFGGYERLFPYQRARVVYKGTQYFVKHWVPQISRTTDQMEQAARSGKQNIVEGSLASATSKEMEIKLTGVALASLGELLEDYRDFLYVNELAEWPKNHPYALRLSQLCRTPGADYDTFRRGIEHADPAICTNVLLGLTRVAIRLLYGQLARLERDFVNDGGLRERMTRARLEFRHEGETTDRRRGERRQCLRKGTKGSCGGTPGTQGTSGTTASVQDIAPALRTRSLVPHVP